MKILTEEKNLIELELENVTLAEILRVYLNKDEDVDFVAWKREHPTLKPILKVETKGKTAKKAVHDAIALVVKDLEKTEKEFEKIK